MSEINRNPTDEELYNRKIDVGNNSYQWWGEDAIKRNRVKCACGSGVLEVYTYGYGIRMRCPKCGEWEEFTY